MGKSNVKRREQIINKLAMKFGLHCWYCGISLKYMEIHVDHITPLCLTHDNSDYNLALTCKFCNFAKGSKDLSEYLAWLSHVRSPNFKCDYLKIDSLATELTPEQRDILKF